jgi:pantoate--beta-alanine ligase
MKTVVSAAELIEAIDAERELPGCAALKVAFVPTMGALHEGHLSLVRKAREYADIVVVSIFVNPLQFGAGEDFDKYPRTLEADAKLLEAAGADLLFAPTVEVIYPQVSALGIEAGIEAANQAAKARAAVHPALSSGLVGTTFEGAARPGHFDGMLAVVARLFEIVNPDFAVFGAKDAQQLFLIRRMAAAEFPDLHIIEAPIVRETTGLAMSSRNRYLDPAALAVAGQLSKALNVGKAAAETLGAKPSLAINAARARLEGVPEAKLDYLTLVDPKSFEPIDDSFTGRALMLIAAVVGSTRLIDNLTIDFQEPFA